MHRERCELHGLLENHRGKEGRWEEAGGAATAGNIARGTSPTAGTWALSITALTSKMPGNPIFGDLLINASFLS